MNTTYTYLATCAGGCCMPLQLFCRQDWMHVIMIEPGAFLTLKALASVFVFVKEAEFST